MVVGPSHFSIYFQVQNLLRSHPHLPLPSIIDRRIWNLRAESHSHRNEWHEILRVHLFSTPTFYRLGERPREVKASSKALASVCRGETRRTSPGVSHHTFLLIISYELFFNIDLESWHFKSHPQSIPFRQSDEIAYYKTSEKNHPLSSQTFLKTTFIESK